MREYEAWFLASLGSLRAHRSVRSDAIYHKDPESPRDAKGELGSLMLEKYRETIHQPAFSALLDIGESRSCPSFDDFVRKLGILLGAATPDL